MPDSALDRLRARLQEFNSTGDMSAITGPEVLADMTALDAGGPEAQFDMAAAEICAWLFWHRSQSPWARSDERDRAVRLFEVLYISDPGAVPPAVVPELQKRFQVKWEQQTLPVSSSARPGADVRQVMNQALMHFQRHQQTKDQVALDAAISGLRRALAAMAPGHPVRPVAQVTLGLALEQQWEQSSSPAALAEAIDLLRAGLDGLPASHQIRPGAQSALGILVAAQYLADGKTGVLSEAEQLMNQAAAAVRPDDPAAAHIRTISNLMQAGHQGSQGRPDVAEQAVVAARARLAGLPPGHPGRPLQVLELGTALALQFGVTRVAANLDETVGVLREAAEIAPPATGQLSAIRAMLGSLLAELATRDANPELRTEAIGILRQSLEANGPAHALSAATHGNLAVVVWQQYQATGEPGLIAEAIEESRRALHRLPDGSPVRVLVRNALAAALQEQHRRTGDAPALADVVVQAESAEPARAGGSAESAVPAGPVALSGNPRRDALPEALAAGPVPEPRPAGDAAVARQSVDWTGGKQVLARPRRTAESEAAALQQVLARVQRGQTAAELLDWPAARAEFSSAISELPYLTGPGPGRDAQEPRLATVAALTADGAAAALNVKEPEGAVDLLERGRSALLSQAFGTPACPAEPMGHELSPASPGPVVLVNLSRYRSDALLLTPADPEVIPLAPDGTLLAAAQQYAKRLADAVRHSSGTEPDRRAAARSELTVILGWLWDTIASPVLARMAEVRPPRGQPSRIWWCTGGPLGQMPMHAAGRDGEAVIDHAISSYTSTVQLLRQAQRLPPGLPLGSGVLAVAMSSTPGRADLPRAAAEMKWLETELGAASLFNTEATRGRILAVLPRFPAVHFACHCTVDLAGSTAGLLCYGHDEHPLTVADLARLNLPNARLAYLPASGTSWSAAGAAAGDAHVSRAFQLAGYRQVIGSLWDVADDMAEAVTHRVYRDLARGGAGGRSGAHALHDAVLAARNDGQHAAEWAPYIHLGI
jgi:hypothetical protein